MRTRCPSCDSYQSVPDAYDGRSVKCRACTQTYTATRDPDIVPDRDPQPSPPPQRPARKYTPVPAYSPATGSVITTVGAIFLLLSLASIGLGDPAAFICIVGSVVIIALGRLMSLLADVLAILLRQYEEHSP